VVETTTAPTHIYAAAGTYTVTLTTTGITGSQDANVKTLTVTVL
jgi:PKD repeat protein